MAEQELLFFMAKSYGHGHVHVTLSQEASMHDTVLSHGGERCGIQAHVILSLFMLQRCR